MSASLARRQDESCERCGLEPCGCPEAAAAIAAAPPPDFGPDEPGPAPPAAAPGEAAAAFAARRLELEATHGGKACCHRERPALCILIDAGGREER
ncbi:MAG: hypothetical protein QOG72_2422 [Sphingomonadales bacterium]|jgi:hypothetical protein|nr:hypothetical protein [Sphingomonadales bacterium]